MKRLIRGTVSTETLIDEPEARSFVVTWLKEKVGLGKFDIIDISTKEIVRRKEDFRSQYLLGVSHRVVFIEISREPATDAQVAAWVVIQNTTHMGDFSK